MSYPTDKAAELEALRRVLDEARWAAWLDPDGRLLEAVQAYESIGCECSVRDGVYHTSHESNPGGHQVSCPRWGERDRGAS